MDLIFNEDGSGSESFNESFLYNDSLHLCAARSLSYDPSTHTLETFPIEVRSGLFIYYSIILIFSTFLNLLIFWIFGTIKKIRDTDSAIGVHIAILNILRTFTEALPSLATAVTGVWSLGPVVCVIQGTSAGLSAIVKRYLMLMLSIDRFLVVFFPFAYPKYRTKAVLLYSTGVWLFSLVILIPTLPGLLDCISLFPSRFFCGYRLACSRHCYIYGTAIFPVSLWTSYITPLILYGALYYKSRKSLNHTIQLAEEVKQSIRKANLTFFLLFLSYFMVTVPAGIIYRIEETVHGIYRYNKLIIILLRLLGNHVTVILVILDAILILKSSGFKESLINLCRRTKKFLKL